jgi:dihydropteroate synthase
MGQKKAKQIWQTSNRIIDYSGKTLVMAILNVTPDSFSDGGRYTSIDKALLQTEKFVEEGADILDIGGESTRPNSERVTLQKEIQRVIPIIRAIKEEFDIPVSVDTSKSQVAEEAINAGAEIINDISGLTFDENIAKVSAKYKTGLILMHLRGEFETMHFQKPVDDIIREVSDGFENCLRIAAKYKVNSNQICLDVGIGFSKSQSQNLELIAKLDKLLQKFNDYPMLIGASRKSFIGKLLDNAPTDQRINGTLAANAIALWNGANILRVHDVRQHVELIKVTEAIKMEL